MDIDPSITDGEKISGRIDPRIVAESLVWYIPVGGILKFRPEDAGKFLLQLPLVRISLIY